jgi:hypothetical protein
VVDAVAETTGEELLVEEGKYAVEDCIPVGAEL